MEVEICCNFNPERYLGSAHKLTFSNKVVIPPKAGIQFFQDLLDAGSGPA